ncbi:IS66 family transposase zinc-finger binding domain-containing protein [Desulfovibrio sp. JC022]|uniref:IS66 family transposase zinc-finger binding domain-containing protein n=1 Tax=Desulfovibrio sp. JC022 TaxID=2593642 RepID=UPI001EF172CD|nr:IS66 family transposase zinc-finger binding domain-containing protein [Desulfovibrio sp. JC022]
MPEIWITKNGRRPISEAYPRVEVVHDIPEEDNICPCGCALTRIGEEVSEKLDIIPQKI